MSKLVDLPHVADPLLAEIAALRAKVAQLQRLADTDPLTGLANRRTLERELARAALRHARRPINMSVALIDLDGFKTINDQFGHAAGDAALCQMAVYLRASFRESDVIGRWGGDEFLVLLPDVTPACAQDRLHALSKALSQSALRLGGRDQQLRISWGITALQTPDVPARVIARADAALYDAKAARSRAA